MDNRQTDVLQAKHVCTVPVRDLRQPSLAHAKCLQAIPKSCGSRHKLRRPMTQIPTAARRASRATLEILGTAGESVVVLAQGPAATQAQQIFEGVMPRTSRMRLRIPQSTEFVVVVTGHLSARIDFQNGRNFQRVDVRAARHRPVL